MAGIVIKIVIEDTHPPVWRRVVVPEHISFYDLHQVIQTVLNGKMHICTFLKHQKTVLKLSQMQEMHIPIIFWRRKFLFLLLQSVKAGFVMCMTWEMTGGINLPSKKNGRL